MLSLFEKFVHSLKLRKKSRGYVLILSAIFIPIILYGVKYCLDLQTMHSKKVEKEKNIFKRCARDAALEVAKKWNPALTYKQQKESMLRIADDIYNKSPAYSDTDLLYDAIPGLEMPTATKTTEGKVFVPLKVEVTGTKSLSPDAKTVAYETKTANLIRSYYWYRYTTGYCPMAAMHFIYMYKHCILDRPLFATDDDLYRDYCYYCSNSSSPEGSSTGWYHYVTFPSDLGSMSQDGSSAAGSMTYTKRVNANDKKIEIAVEKDTIKVTTDLDVNSDGSSTGYAVPAQCNLDLILSVPVNAAACNQDNQDSNTVTEGEIYIPTSTTPTSEAKLTPIYQITRAYRTFLKNFFYTRGMQVGVVPYSGKVSLPGSSSTCDRTSWTQTLPLFNSTPYLNGEYYHMISAILYGAKGVGGYALTTASDVSSAYSRGLICRGDRQSYNSNYFIAGDLLSTANPTNYRFYRAPYQSCAPGDADFLSMKCLADAPYNWINPYYILEMNPDVKFIYEMMQAFYPYWDDRNVSNFVFIPVTWANNLLQTWSRNTCYSATNTASDTSGLGRLSTPSKMTSGRKKALILVVNKPDWFEPGELTYLGYDNDYSEVPIVESDCIRFDVDYSDKTRHFADGTLYDGTIQGAKKILKFYDPSGKVKRSENSGFYECVGSGEVSLIFPKKYLLKVVVESLDGASDGIKWEMRDVNLGQKFGTSDDAYRSYGHLGVGPVVGADGDQLVNIASNPDFEGGLIYSSDGVNWVRRVCSSRNPYGGDVYWTGPVYANGVWVFVNSPGTYRGDFCVFYSEDNLRTILPVDGFRVPLGDGSSAAWVVAYGNGKFMLMGIDGCYTSPDGKTWSRISSNPARMGGYVLGHCNGKWIFQPSDTSEVVFLSEDNGRSWMEVRTNLTGISPSCGGANIGNYFYIFYKEDGYIWRTKDGTNWERVCRLPASQQWTNITYYNNKLYVFNHGYTCCIGTFSDSTVQFPRISADNDSCTNSGEYKIEGRKEFFIEASQITEGSDNDYRVTMALQNVRLISAEITNRPYEKRKPPHKVSGVTDATGRANQELSIILEEKVPVTFDVEYKGGKEILGQSSDFVSSGSLSGSGEGTLTFPCKGTVYLKAAPLPMLEKSSSLGFSQWGTFSYANGAFWSCNYLGGKIYTSTDGVNWSYVAAVPAFNISRMAPLSSAPAWIPDLGYVLLGRNSDVGGTDASEGDIFESHSADGKTWSAREKLGNFKPKSFHSTGVEFCSFGDKIVGVSGDTDGGIIIYENGQWEIYDGVLKLGSYPGGICSGNGKVLVVNFVGKTTTSTDGKTWTTPKEGLSDLYKQAGGYIVTVTYGNGKFIAMTKNCYAASSVDGENWTILGRLAEIDDGNVAIAYGGDGRLLMLSLKEVFTTSSSSNIKFTNILGTPTEWNVSSESNVTIGQSRMKESNLKYTLTNASITYGEWSPNSMIKIGNKNRLITSDQTMIITPDEYDYEKQSDGTYLLALKLSCVKISNIRTIGANIRLKNPTLPSRSRVVDFGKNSDGNFEFNIDGSTTSDMGIGSSPYGIGNMGIRWNLTLSCWEIYQNSTNRSLNDCFWMMTLPGDMYMLADATNITTSEEPRYEISINNGSTRNEYFGNNYYRSYWPFTTHHKAVPEYNNAGYTFSTYNADLPLVMAGMTLPINAMLYCGANGSGMHAYEWQSDASKTITCDATEATKKVTKSACEKLKSDWGSNIRIYLVKYRKQLQYKHKTTKQETNFDYSYLNDCASGSSYIYDVSDESGLNDTLTEIAQDLKSWAGYTEAKNVEKPT